ncbi:MAG: hypothetical protein AABY27_07450 [Pseudomonadota bacterium]
MINEIRHDNEYKFFNDLNIISATAGSIIFVVNALTIEELLNLKLLDDTTLKKINYITGTSIMIVGGAVGWFIAPYQFGSAIYAIGAEISFVSGIAIPYVVSSYVPDVFRNEEDSVVWSGIKLLLLSPIILLLVNKFIDPSIELYNYNENQYYENWY